MVEAIEVLGKRVAIAERQRSLEGLQSVKLAKAETVDRGEFGGLLRIDLIGTCSAAREAVVSPTTITNAAPTPVSTSQLTTTIAPSSTLPLNSIPHSPPLTAPTSTVQLPSIPKPSPLTPKDKVIAPRPSILAFHTLRSGLGKLGPMPVVDVGNPNLISFGDAEGESGQTRKRVPYSS